MIRVRTCEEVTCVLEKHHVFQHAGVPSSGHVINFLANAVVQNQSITTHAPYAHAYLTNLTGKIPSTSIYLIQCSTSV